MLQEIMQVAINTFTLDSACRVGAYILVTVTNLLSWSGSLWDTRRSQRPIGKFYSFFSGNGSFDNEAHTR